MITGDFAGTPSSLEMGTSRSSPLFISALPRPVCDRQTFKPVHKSVAVSFAPFEVMQKSGCPIIALLFPRCPALCAIGKRLSRFTKARLSLSHPSSRSKKWVSPIAPLSLVPFPLNVGVPYRLVSPVVPQNVGVPQNVSLKTWVSRIVRTRGCPVSLPVPDRSLSGKKWVSRIVRLASVSGARAERMVFD
ncbi:MAG: hypothetical protein KatS3mg077_1566 [Candidatus Binatia bacterium]|nr:MAG: hypothetical protein KatS3mg077_1566 [Candidatus Binatia bacterium]